MKNVLMCKPSYFQVKYQINPWMRNGSVDQKKAMDQWKNLVSIYERLGIKVWVINQIEELPDMVFCADQGIINDDKILLSNFRFLQRRGESEIFEKWFTNFGLKVLKLPKNVYFEGGGESIRWKDKLFVGTGFRTSCQAVKSVGDALNLDTIKLELLDKRFYHLDTCFFVLNEKISFYFPPAFSKKSIDLIKKYIPKAVELKEEDALKFAANSMVIGKSVIVQSGNKNFAKLIEDLGYQPIMAEVGEFIKAGGGIHCLSGNLDE